MAILNILKDSEPTLKKTSRPVDKISPRILQLIEDMSDTLINVRGIGLAAPQVGVLRRLFVVDMGDKIQEFINPQIIEQDGEQDDIEACLSFPNKYGRVKRPNRVVIKAINKEGEEFTLEGTGLMARAFCHESDHLDGILYTEKAYEMVDPEELE